MSTNKNFHLVEELLGTSDIKTVRKIVEALSLVQSMLTDTELDLFRHLKEDPSILEPTTFGAKIPYTPMKRCHPEEAGLLTNMSQAASVPAPKKFTMVYTGDHSKSLEFQQKDFLKYINESHKKYSTETSFEQFCTLIENCLKNSRTNAQGELYDLLGCDQLDFISYILKHRDPVEKFFSTQKTLSKASHPKMENRPNFGCQVTVQSQKEKELMKQVRKEEKKYQKATNKFENGETSDEDFDPLLLRLKRQQALQAAQMPVLAPVKQKFLSTLRPVESYPFVFDCQKSSKTTPGFVSGQKLILPENVTRKDSSLCEEVQIPVSSNDLDFTYTPINIASLDEIGQMAFAGIKQLNRIQSTVFNAAYNSGENLLICAPTGAGKTNVALLSVLHQLRLHMDDGVLRKNEFKIVYIAPMKALAAEMTASFSKRLGCLGISVRELTGDMQLTKTELQQTQMIVTTPEKWDVVTRKGTGDIALTSIVKLLIIDEVHLLHGDRGPVVEALVARTLRQVGSRKF